VPKVFTLIDKHFGWYPEQVNLDMGGGKYDTATKFLEKRLVTNLIYDPYNRTMEHNQEVIYQLKKRGGADTATISNVLNVVETTQAMLDILGFVYVSLRDGGKCHVTCYAAKQAGVTKKDCFQQGKPLVWYEDVIRQIFGSVYRKHGMLIAVK